MRNNVTRNLQLDLPPQRLADKTASRSDGDRAPGQARWVAETKFVGEAIGRKHSDKFVRLFEFLRDRTIEGRPPTEVEIADEIFSTGRQVGAPQDAAVRVCVHRLRKTMDEIYAERPGPRLLIPRGEYSIVLTDEDTELDNGPPPNSPEHPPSRASSRKVLWLTLMAFLASGSVAWWIFDSYGSGHPTSALADTALWQPITDDGRPTTVVLGDYYLFAQSSPLKAAHGAPPRLIWDPAINGKEDLDFYLMRHPEEASSVADLDQRYVPTSVVAVLGRLYATVSGINGNSPRQVAVTSALQLAPEVLKSSNVVYVGQLSGLGLLLRDPLFQASGFRVGATYDELIDKASGQHYRSDGVVMTDERTPRRDYGYIASLPGPSGNNIVVIAGTRDPGLLEMAELASDAAKLKSIAPRGKAEPQGFEALYQVRTMGSLNLGSQLLIRRPLQTRGIWDLSAVSQRFPNDAYEGPGHDER